jgi:AcrR family transcriptional regulator
MSRPPTLTRDEVLLRMRLAFRTNGYDGATLATLAAATGLTRATLYHHFPEGKERMAAATLEDLRGWSVAHVLAPLRGPGEPADRLRAMTAALDELYAGGESACLIGVFSVGEALQQFGDRLRQSLTDLMTAIEEVLVEAGIPATLAHERAQDALARIQGSLIVGRVLHDTSHFQKLMAHLPGELLAR